VKNNDDPCIRFGALDLSLSKSVSDMWVHFEIYTLIAEIFDYEVESNAMIVVHGMKHDHSELGARTEVELWRARHDLKKSKT
jgi:hypothetical protein